MSASIETISFDRAGRIPAPGDNVAIAVRRLEAGTVIASDGGEFRLPHTVMEGHRFVLAPIAAGGMLLSWGLPFGRATRDLAPGEYVCNAKILRALAERDIDFALPDEANFTDHLAAHDLDESTFVPGEQVPAVATPGTFMGYPRAGGRGVGTRNFILLLGTTARTAAFVEQLAARLAGEAAGHADLDGIVAVPHTEGGGESRPNNLELVLRALAGFVVHPNAGAVLAVDYGTEPFTNDTLREHMVANGYPLDAVPHTFFRVDGDLDASLDRAASIVRGWIPEVAACRRSAQPLANLRLALQCGGSDAFSGVSGNALAGWVAKELIRNGGGANLAETDELIGAEPYVLSNVRDLPTARRFLDKIAQFKAYAANHGASAEGNPSGGNNYRGLYNIALKSIGAARKKDPEVRLDRVLDYAERMDERGYYFMDSPGNDLESIAGQVASGSNLIVFITGNGSITNFPFVPTLKFVTTTGRFRMLENEMDVNAGRYNDGLSMDDLGRETFELARAVASGQRSKGELAGHAQVQLWRDWPQADASRLEALRSAREPDGRPLAVRAAAPASASVEMYPTARGPALDQVGLVMPTSLCSGQVAKLIADHLNARAGGPRGVSRYVALVHTEGCGSANGEPVFLQTMLGHLRHRAVRRAVLLEHGCERTHNDAVRHYLADRGESSEGLGFASVQLDGGIAKVRDKVAAWFDASLAEDPLPAPSTVGAEALCIGLVSSGPVGESAAATFAALAAGVVAAGGTVVVASNATLARSDAFRAALLDDPRSWRPTLGYGQPAEAPGLHVMDAPTESALETLTGLGGCGVELMVAHIGDTPMQAHPMIPLLQASGEPAVLERYRGDMDLILEATGSAGAGAILARIADVASRRYTPRLFGRGITGFQLSRGPLGLSL
ncbi:MAG: UxaA family hydrolase [Chromatiales bacterium]|nr:UxaA family hydrolase [Chromatiales bacterium]